MSAAMTAAQTAVNTVETLAPAILTALAATDPKIAALVQALPVIVQLSGILQQAGGDTPEQLAELFTNVGKGVAATHAQWLAMNPQPPVA